MKKFNLLSILVFAFCYFFCFSSECCAKPLPDRCTHSGTNDYKLGNIVEFGCYRQDELARKTPIKWRVLDVKNGKALLLSEKLLDAQPYNEEYKPITWEHSSIRRWLNNEFINEAFNSQEKFRISLTLLDNWDNQEYGTDAGNDTTDRVFLLSLDEVYKYLPKKNQREVKITKYAIKNGASVCDDEETICDEDGCNNYFGNGWWWLRSPGGRQTVAADVSAYGGIFMITSGVTLIQAVRPALWIKLY